MSEGVRSELAEGLERAVNSRTLHKVIPVIHSRNVFVLPFIPAANLSKRREARCERAAANVVNILRMRLLTLKHQTTSRRRERWHPVSGASRILAKVAAKTGIPVEVIKGVCRTKAVSAARHEAAFEIALGTQLSLAQIADILHRDHTSIGYGICKYATQHGLPMPRGMIFRKLTRKRITYSGEPTCAP